MKDNKQEMIEGWLDKANKQLFTAKNYLKTQTHFSEAIQASQIVIELSVKAILLFLNIDFSPSHGWRPEKQEFEKIAIQIEERQLIQLLNEYFYNTFNLPRLLFLMFFWSQFYITAKYGIEAGYLSPANKILEKKEAELSIKHAEECLSAANSLINNEKIMSLLSK